MAAVVSLNKNQMDEILRMWRSAGVYQIYERSAILYGSKTRCLREREITLSRRTKTALMKAVCGMNTKRMVRAAPRDGMNNGHMLWREEGSISESNILKCEIN